MRDQGKIVFFTILSLILLQYKRFFTSAARKPNISPQNIPTSARELTPEKSKVQYFPAFQRII